jgi:hypothetical protein
MKAYAVLKQNELQWFQNLSQTHGDNLNNARRETSRRFRDKGRKCMKVRKVTNLELTYKKLRMVICFQTPHNILNRWKNYLCHLWNVHNAKNVTQTEMLTTESGVREVSCFEVKISIES